MLLQPEAAKRGLPFTHAEGCVSTPPSRSSRVRAPLSSFTGADGCVRTGQWIPNLRQLHIVGSCASKAGREGTTRWPRVAIEMPQRAEAHPGQMSRPDDARWARTNSRHADWTPTPRAVEHRALLSTTRTLLPHTARGWSIGRTRVKEAASTRAHRRVCIDTCATTIPFRSLAC
eukprot:scaffold10670_cov142-Isochrysis_galbana.AAC.10